jgi:pimeloyl-ACP methyl ester carboxylesterase
VVAHVPGDPRGLVLFGAGAGGNPARYRSVLDALADSGLVVLAPASPRFDPQSVSAEDLCERPRRLIRALADFGATDLPISAVGHSVGGWAALCLAGAQPWTRDGRRLTVAREPRVTRLVLFAPALGWFRAPGALDAVQASITAFAGSRDTVTPPETLDLLRTARSPVLTRTFDGAGHYDYMDDPPPGIATDSDFDRAGFLDEVSARTVAALS